MPQRRAFLHVGLPHSGGSFLPAAVAAHAEALAAYDVRQPARSEDEMFRAAVELRRDHHAWGLRRKDVEGAWSGICRRAYPGKDTVVFGHDLLAAAGPDEIALLVDRLPGFAVHVVVTVGSPDPRVALFPGDHDLGDVLARWAGAVRSPDRVHVLVAEPGPRAEQRRALWEAYGRVVGFEAAGLPLDDLVLDAPRQDTGTLRLLAESAGDLASADQLVEVVAAWSKEVAGAGYDLHGDLGTLATIEEYAAGATAAGADYQVTALSDALTDALAEVTRLRRQTAQLETRNAKLARKRRKLKARLAGAIGA